MLLQHVLHGNMKHVDHSKRCCDDEHLLRKREWRDLRALLVSFAFVVSNMSLVSWKNERGWQVCRVEKEETSFSLGEQEQCRCFAMHFLVRFVLGGFSIGVCRLLLTMLWLAVFCWVVDRGLA